MTTFYSFSTSSLPFFPSLYNFIVHYIHISYSSDAQELFVQHIQATSKQLALTVALAVEMSK